MIQIYLHWHPNFHPEVLKDPEVLSPLVIVYLRCIQRFMYAGKGLPAESRSQAERGVAKP